MGPNGGSVATDSAIFVIDLNDANRKLILRKVLLITFCGTIISYFKNEKSKRSQKTVGIEVFLTIFA
jgi:hypothetical protein